MIISVISCIGGGWSVRKGGAKRSLRKFNTKLPAINYAKTIAKKEGLSLYIHKRDGRTQARFRYRRLIK